MPISRRRFQTAELMQKAVDEYFAEKEANEERPTLTGVALALGFSSLGALNQYKGYTDQDFKWVIDIAKMRVMEYVEAHGKTAFDKLLMGGLDSDVWKERSASEVVTQQLPELNSEVIRAQMEASMRKRLEERIANSIEHKPEPLPEDDESWI